MDPLCQAGDALSISLWVNFSSLTTSQYLLDTRFDQSGSDTGGYSLYYSIVSNLVILNVNGVRAVAFSATSLQTSRWYNITAVCDAGAGNLALYLNGALANTAPFRARPELPECANPLVLGDSGDLSNDGLDGYLADVRFFTQALTDDQITALYGAPMCP